MGVANPSMSDERNCWHCGVSLPEQAQFCGECKVVQPLEIKDSFELLNLEPRFNIDMSSLESHYLSLVTLFHPDRYATMPPSVRLVAERNASMVNDAYETLNNPLKRGIALLKKRGIAVSLGEDHTIQDPELLMAAMQDREDLEEAQDEVQLQKLAKKNKEHIKECHDKFGRLYDGGDDDAARLSLLHLRYSMRLAEAIALKKRQWV